MSILYNDNGWYPLASPVAHQQPKADHCISCQIQHAHMVQNYRSMQKSEHVGGQVLVLPSCFCRPPWNVDEFTIINRKIGAVDLLVLKSGCTTPPLLHLIPMSTYKYCRIRFHFSPSLWIATCQLGSANFCAKFPFQAAWPERTETSTMFLFLGCM